MEVNAVISIVFAASTLSTFSLALVTVEALTYVSSIFLAASFIILLSIAKHTGWSTSTAGPTSVYAQPVAQQPQTQYVPQQQYAYNHPNGQPQYQYQQQAPMYNGQPGLVK